MRPDIRDVHCYGGVLLLGAGAAWAVEPGVGLIVVGLALFYLALRRVA